MKKICIAGAGPGGLQLALELGRMGNEVHLFESKSEQALVNGHDWSDAVDLGVLYCAGLPVPQAEGDRYVGPGVKTYPEGIGLYEPHRFNGLAIFSGDYSHKTNTEVDFRYIMVDRKQLSLFHLARCREVGVHLHFGCKVTGLLGTTKGELGDLDIQGLVVEENGESKEYKADLTVDATGSVSALRTMLEPACIGKPFDTSGITMAYRTVRRFEGKPEAPHATTNGKPPVCDMYRLLPVRGFSWVHFHDDDIIDVGVGVKLHNDEGLVAEDIVNEKVAGLPGVTDEELRSGKGTVLTTDPPEALVTNGFAVLGDAAGMIHPRNGCGVPGALLGATLLAQVVFTAPDCSIASLWPFAQRWFTGRGGAYVGLMTRGRTNTIEETNFLMRNNIMNGEDMTNGYNAVFAAGYYGFSTRMLPAMKENAALLKEMAANGMAGAARYRAFMGYPQQWNADAYAQWYGMFQTL